MRRGDYEWILRLYEIRHLYVDDEEKSLKYFTRAFEDQFCIFTASNAQDGLRILEEHRDDIGVLMTDQRMPGEKGVWLLEKARHLRPRIIRILVTAYSDMEAAIAAVNTGAIYRYISKPWDPPQWKPPQAGHRVSSSSSASATSCCARKWPCSTT